MRPDDIRPQEVCHDPSPQSHHPLGLDALRPRLGRGPAGACRGLCLLLRPEPPAGDASRRGGSARRREVRDRHRCEHGDVPDHVRRALERRDRSHIHGFAGPGVPAGVVFPLPLGNPKVGVWNYAEADEANILAGNTYANIHTTNNPGGEIRGQIVPFNALPDGAQETPANATTGKGWATATVDTVLNQISYYLFYEGLTGAPN